MTHWDSGTKQRLKSHLVLAHGKGHDLFLPWERSEHPCDTDNCIGTPLKLHLLQNAKAVVKKRQKLWTGKLQTVKMSQLRGPVVQERKLNRDLPNKDIHLNLSSALRGGAARLKLGTCWKSFICKDKLF